MNTGIADPELERAVVQVESDVAALKRQRYNTDPTNGDAGLSLERKLCLSTRSAEAFFLGDFWWSSFAMDFDGAASRLIASFREAAQLMTNTDYKQSVSERIARIERAIKTLPTKDSPGRPE